MHYPRRKPFERHGFSKTPEYRIWSAMIDRCTNPNHPQHKDYLDRGIEVCQAWKDSFLQFIHDVGWRPKVKNMTLERLDNDGDYVPGNVVWATRKANQRNTRWNRWLTFQGRNQMVMDWAAEYGINPTTLVGRLNRGMSPQDALTAPIGCAKAPISREEYKRRQHAYYKAHQADWARYRQTYKAKLAVKQ